MANNLESSQTEIVVDIVLKKLEERNLIKKSNYKNAYEHTILLLKNYNRLKKSKEKINKQIKNLENSKNNLDAFSNPNRDFGEKVQSSNVKINLDSINDRILFLEQDIVIIDNYVKFIDNTLTNLTEKEYDLINRCYFQNKKPIDIALELDCDVSTIYRQLNKIIHEKIKVELFPIAYIHENN